MTVSVVLRFDSWHTWFPDRLLHTKLSPVLLLPML